MLRLLFLLLVLLLRAYYSISHLQQISRHLCLLHGPRPRIAEFFWSLIRWIIQLNRLQSPSSSSPSAGPIVFPLLQMYSTSAAAINCWKLAQLKCYPTVWRTSFDQWRTGGARKREREIPNWVQLVLLTNTNVRQAETFLPSSHSLTHTANCYSFSFRSTSWE